MKTKLMKYLASNIYQILLLWLMLGTVDNDWRFYALFGLCFIAYGVRSYSEDFDDGYMRGYKDGGNFAVENMREQIEKRVNNEV